MDFDRNEALTKPSRHSPQGGLSRRLANELLDNLDRELENRSLRFLSICGGLHHIREKVGRRRTRTDDYQTLHRIKTESQPAEGQGGAGVELHLPGCIIENSLVLRIAPTSVKKLKAKIRLMPRRNSPTPLCEVIAELPPPRDRRGTNYLKLAAINKLCLGLDEWTAENYGACALNKANSLKSSVPSSKV